MSLKKPAHVACTGCCMIHTGCCSLDGTHTPIVEPVCFTDEILRDRGLCSACGLDLADSESSVYCPWCLQGAQHYEARVRQIIEGLIGPAVTDVGSLRNEAFADALAALDEGASDE